MVNISLENGKIDNFLHLLLVKITYLTLHVTICIFNPHWKVRLKKKKQNTKAAITLKNKTPNQQP